MTNSGLVEFAAARWPTLVRSAILMGLPPPEAEDAAQEALVRCHRFWSRVERADDVDAYVFRILQNEVRRSLRRSGNLSPQQALSEPIPDGSERVLTAMRVRELLRLLPIDARTVIVLRYYADLSEAQMADVLRVPVGTVKSRLSRAQEKFAALHRAMEEE